MTVIDLPLPVLDLPETEDGEIVSHIVFKKDLLRSQQTGEAILSLCGEVWVPRHDPDSYPVCKRCLEVFGSFAEPVEG